MHFCVYVFVAEDGSLEELVARALAPYSEDLEIAPYKVYPDRGEIAAMAKHYGLKPTDRRQLAKHMHDWNGGHGGVDKKGLYAVKNSNRSGKWDWYEIGGRFSGRFPGNVISASALAAGFTAELLPFAVLTPDGLWDERETVISKGWMKWRIRRKTTRQWLGLVRAALAEHPDHRVVCVDIHC
jgi:hypothetical protein